MTSDTRATRDAKGSPVGDICRAVAGTGTGGDGWRDIRSSLTCTAQRALARTPRPNALAPGARWAGRSVSG